MNKKEIIKGISSFERLEGKEIVKRMIAIGIYKLHNYKELPLSSITETDKAICKSKFNNLKLNYLYNNCKESKTILVALLNKK